MSSKIKSRYLHVRPTFQPFCALIWQSLMMPPKKEIAEKYDLTIGVCAHAGDGNTHPVVCFDERRLGDRRRRSQDIE